MCFRNVFHSLGGARNFINQHESIKIPIIFFEFRSFLCFFKKHRFTDADDLATGLACVRRDSDARSATKSRTLCRCSRVLNLGELNLVVGKD